MNYKNDAMVGVIPHTDSRFRGDLRYYEEDQVDEAETEKVLIEEEQRRKRKLVEPGVIHTPKFFRSMEHPFITADFIGDGHKNPMYYPLIENEGDNKGYWERRLNKDWDDLPRLFGPFPDKNQ